MRGSLLRLRLLYVWMPVSRPLGLSHLVVPESEPPSTCLLREDPLSRRFPSAAMVARPATTTVGLPQRLHREAKAAGPAQPPPPPPPPPQQQATSGTRNMLPIRGRRRRRLSSLSAMLTSSQSAVLQWSQRGQDAARSAEPRRRPSSSPAPREGGAAQASKGREVHTTRSGCSNSSRRLCASSSERTYSHTPAGKGGAWWLPLCLNWEERRMFSRAFSSGFLKRFLACSRFLVWMPDAHANYTTCLHIQKESERFPQIMHAFC